MADALPVLGSKLPEDGGPNKPVIWFSRQDAPKESMVPSCALEPVFSLKEYTGGYGDIINFLSYGCLLDNRTKHEIFNA